MRNPHPKEKRKITHIHAIATKKGEGVKEKKQPNKLLTCDYKLHSM
jgi:hypothetical protein